MAQDAPNDETFWEKAVRKTKQDPIVPIGAVITCGFLISGLRAFHSGNKPKAQILMRGRVVAQAVTVIGMAFGALYGMKPHDRPKDYEEKLARQNNESN